MAEYKDCFVAFLDVLGFKEISKVKTCDDIKQIFDTLMDFSPTPLIKGSEVYNHVNYYIMSDSIVIYIDSQIEGAFIALTEVCLQLQVKLACNNPTILVRGAIEKGSLYCEGNVIFGEGLSNAYMLENTLAKYPRVIFTEKTKEIGLENSGKLYMFDYNNMFYKMDDDLLYYIDYLKTFAYVPSLKAKNVSEVIHFENEYFEALFNHIKNTLYSETNYSIREKYLWLRDKLLKRIDNMPEVKKHFDELERQQREAKAKRFDLALKD